MFPTAFLKVLSHASFQKQQQTFYDNLLFFSFLPPLEMGAGGLGLILSVRLSVHPQPYVGHVWTDFVQT